MLHRGRGAGAMSSNIDIFGGFYFNSPVTPSDIERLRRLERESWLGPPPDNILGRRDKWLAEQREYTLMQADALLAQIHTRLKKS